MNIVIIPMRSGSKGLVNKNIKEFNGKPLFYWTLIKVEKLFNEEIIDKVIVSSDSNKYLRLVESFNFKGIQTSKRPTQFATDDRTTEDVMYYELNKLNMGEGTIAVIEVTSPLIPYKDLKKMINFNQKKYASSFLTVEDKGNFWLKQAHKTTYVQLYNKRLMRQENIEPLYKEVGAWSVNKSSFVLYNNRIVTIPDVLTIPSIFGTSINDIYDFNLTEMIFKEHKAEILE